jgi:DNA-binding NarL/FixJ family response regulator
VLRAIRTVNAGKRLMPPEVAQRLSNFPQMALTPRETEARPANGLGNRK